MNDRISTLLKEKHINNKNVNVMAKSILITGAGGTVGEALARFLLERYCDKTVILLDHSDSALNVCYKNLNKYKNAHFYIGDYADTKMFNWLIRKYNVDTVFHCAAYKIVPMVDLNPVSAFENTQKKAINYFGCVAKIKSKIVFLCPVMKLLFLKIYLAIPKELQKFFWSKILQNIRIQNIAHYDLVLF